VNAHDSSGSVAPSLFRLRAFELSWRTPMMRRASRSTLVGDRRALLYSVLVLETDRWLALGQRVGYFADIPFATSPARDPTARRAESWSDRLWSGGEPPTDLDPLTFSCELTEATEQLTPARLEFLALILFEPYKVFQARLGEVRELADAITRRPWLSVPPRAVDRVAWSLDGAAFPDSALRWSPAFWRQSIDDDVWHTGAVEPRRLIPRKVALDDVRKEIAAAMEWHIESSQSPAEGREAAVIRGSAEVAPPDAWLPQWVLEMGQGPTPFAA
jgi:hypothetical protein